MKKAVAGILIFVLGFLAGGTGLFLFTSRAGADSALWRLALEYKLRSYLTPVAERDQVWKKMLGEDAILKLEAQGSLIPKSDALNLDIFAKTLEGSTPSPMELTAKISGTLQDPKVTISEFKQKNFKADLKELLKIRL